MSDDLSIELSSGLDQALPLMGMEKTVFSRVEAAIEKAFADEDMERVWAMGIGLNAMGRATGLGLAKLAHGGLQIWLRLKLGGEAEYYNEAMVGFGKHIQTVKRYVAIWSMFDDGVVPNVYLEKMYAIGVKMLSPIAQAVKEGYEIPKDAWRKLAAAVDEQEVRAIVKEITGKAENSNNRKLFIDRDGDITVVKKGEIGFVGHLDVTSTSVLVLETIERIKSGSFSAMLEK
jgi:hypothetical protein